MLSSSSRRRIGAIPLAVAAAASLVLSACAPGGSSPQAESGGIAVVALTSEPGVFNPLFSSEASSDLAYAFVMEPLFTQLGDGSYVPVLAETIPTLDNGDVSEDGTQVTYRLREGITWSDGEALTADDLAFTVEVAQNPESGAQAPIEYTSIVGTEVADPQTLIVTFGGIQTGYLNLFADILPAHRFDSSAIQIDDPLVRLPLGTGPFVFEDWKSGDEITLAANEDYWKDPELPRLDGITLKVTPDRQVALSGFISGDYDTVDFFTGSDFAEIESAQSDGAPLHLQVDSQYAGYVEYLWFNHTNNGDPAQPHPVLSDPVIREAIDRAIDREAIVNDLLGGYGVLTGAFISSGFGSVNQDATAYDPDAAAKALDDAGWIEGADGVREKNGVRASLRFQTIAGDQERALYQQLIQQNLAAVGIETVIDNAPAGAIFDTYEASGLLATGDYDILMSRDGRYPDPGGWWVYSFTTHSIPSAENNYQAFSYSHWSNPRYDGLAYEQSQTIDLDRRVELLHEINELFTSERVALPVFATVLGLAWNDALVDVDPGYWQGIWNTESSAHWALAE